MTPGDEFAECYFWHFVLVVLGAFILVSFFQ
jgi:hypothetical protein